MGHNRNIDLVLLGSTGYTGRLCAEYIAQHFPTDLKWALAGPLYGKMEGVAKHLKQLSPDRASPELLPVQLCKVDLAPIARRARIIINCIGPYQLHSTSIVEVCAANGTHYVDATAEMHWIRDIIDKFYKTAKASGAVIIPSVGIESAPADILTWSMVKLVREQLSCHTRDLVCSIDDIKASGISGGTLLTILTTFDRLSVSDLLKTWNPFFLAASPPPSDLPQEPIFRKLIGVRRVCDLGILTSCPSGQADVATVHRSSTLMPDLYGRRFTFGQFLRVRNAVVGVLLHAALMFSFCLLLIPPVRTLLRKVIYAPGCGPRKESCINDHIEYRAVSTADQNVPLPKRAFGRLRYVGNLYAFAGLLLAEAAAVILQNEEKVKRVSRCGVVTPAMLGQEYVDRLEKAGCVIETKMFEY